jgi:uncharacterized protein
MSVPETTENQENEYRGFLSRGEFRIQCCNGCSLFRYPSRWICPGCLSETWEWRRASGAGEIECLIWYMKPVDERFAKTPYSVCLVRLDEGPRLIANLVDTAPGGASVGDRVAAVLDTGFSGDPVVNFRLARGDS